jgi:hypothetical protein
MRNGHNQYPPMAGVASLRGAIADKIEHLYGRRYDAATEITVTAGATQALLTAILCAVHPGDEVIVIEPTYDSYLPSIELAGGKPVFVTLDAPDYAIPFDRLAAAITPKTRMILINTPHNPTGTVWREADLRRLEEIVRGTNVLILSDEVYEHMVYDGARHESVARYPELAARSFIVSSFGKTFHVTGWKIGYVAAPAALTGIPQGSSVQRVHGEHADAGDRRLSARPGAVSDLPDFYQKKRDFFRAGLGVRASSCCRARARTSSASIIRRSATCPKRNSPSGSRRRSVWRPFPCRRSITRRTNRASCASASPNRRARSRPHWNGWRARNRGAAASRAGGRAVLTNARGLLLQRTPCGRPRAARRAVPTSFARLPVDARVEQKIAIVDRLRRHPEHRQMDERGDVGKTEAIAER